jgi:deoxyribodipyrimidine photo-lyase
VRWCVDLRRVRSINRKEPKQGAVVYWMSRDQRVRDNWALLFAQETALKARVPLAVVFCLAPKFLNATMRQYGFLLRGLEGVEESLRQKNMAFFLLSGEPSNELPSFLERNGAGTLITDFDPLRIKRKWKDEVGRRISIPFFEVDAHNIVPCWIASSKQEYGAYTLRPKLHRLLAEFLTAFPVPRRHPLSWPGRCSPVDWTGARRAIKADRGVPEITWLKPGEKEARRMLLSFLKRKLASYASVRNDPVKDGQSNLSPYVHFGHLSAQRIVLEVLSTRVAEESKESFLEELIVRRELSDNFCFYNPDYDNSSSFPDWARESHIKHGKDIRERLYSLQQLEEARTHDDLWNASQREMVVRGKMHGYLRMYWAKKILEWTRSPEEAMKIAIYLNDRYELDGRDPNGYTGIAWSIGGVHDRAWGERPVFGKIRYMSYNGCRSKFDVEAYIGSIKRLKKMEGCVRRKGKCGNR